MHMGHVQIEKELRTWINEANSPKGPKSPEVDSAEWVTAQFIRWWHDQVGECLNSAEYSAACLRDELAHRRGDERAEGMMREITHIQRSLVVLRTQMGLIDASAGSE